MAPNFAPKQEEYVDVGAWTINAAGRVYGPFSSDRMRSFASEGRLAANSMVAQQGTTEWREARTEAEFAGLFDPHGETQLSALKTA